MPLNLDNMDNSNITNRNEKKIIVALDTFFEEPGNKALFEKLSKKDLQDVYALTLNLLPARYAHNTTIIVNEPIGPAQIRSTIDEAIKTVTNNPKI